MSYSAGLVQDLCTIQETPQSQPSGHNIIHERTENLFHQSIDISRTTEYRGWLKVCYNVQELSPGQISVGFDIVMGVYHNAIHLVAEACKERLQNELVHLNIRDMDNSGLGKIRFVGAWAINRVSNKAKRYVRDNMYTDNIQTRMQVRLNVRKIQLLEDMVIIPYDILCLKTAYPATLSVTEMRQFRTHGLTHVSDGYYLFILEVEERRVELLNAQMFKIHGV